LSKLNNSTIQINSCSHNQNIAGSPFNGYIQDVRIYKGLAKYTQNFIPASTDPDILPDTPSGVAYSSNVALVPSTDGAVAFDGSGDYLSIPSSDDFQRNRTLHIKLHTTISTTHISTKHKTSVL
jgi:hypothetical protein